MDDAKHGKGGAPRPGRRHRDSARADRQHASTTGRRRRASTPAHERDTRPAPGHLGRDAISAGEARTLLVEAASGAPPDLSDPLVVRRILRQHGIHPNKGFGQHLLVDREALDALVAAAELTRNDTVLEVGAGAGVLTAALAERARRVVAVELEREILPVLRENTARFTNVEIMARDLLTVRPEEVFGRDAYKLVANLPYAITAATLRHFLETEARPTRLVVMVQREVAERLAARPGDLSLLGLSVQFYGKPEIVRMVASASFFPPPKVASAIVRILVFPEPPLDPAARNVLFALAHAGFAERRKQLHNTLARNLAAPRETIAGWLAAAGIDPMRRAEALSLADWLRLTAIARAGKPDDWTPERR